MTTIKFTAVVVLDIQSIAGTTPQKFAKDQTIKISLFDETANFVSFEFEDGSIAQGINRNVFEIVAYDPQRDMKNYLRELLPINSKVFFQFLRYSDTGNQLYSFFTVQGGITPRIVNIDSYIAVILGLSQRKRTKHGFIWTREPEYLIRKFSKVVYGGRGLNAPETAIKADRI